MGFKMILQSIMFAVILLSDLNIANGAALDESCASAACSTDNAVCESDVCVCKGVYKKDGTECVEKGLGDTCSVNDDCTSVANSECESTTCKCSNGYTQIGDACVRGLTNPCSTDNDCSAVENAECDTTCKCSNGYKANDATCDKVYGTECTGTASCDGLDNSVCAETKCECASDYVESKNVCTLTVSHTDCPNGDECPANAMCEDTKKCKCDAGYTENADMCVAESGAASTKAIIGIAFGWMWILLNVISIM